MKAKILSIALKRHVEHDEKIVEINLPRPNKKVWVGSFFWE